MLTPYVAVVAEGEIVHVMIRHEAWPYMIRFNAWREDRKELAALLILAADKLQRVKDATHKESYGDPA